MKFIGLLAATIAAATLSGAQSRWQISVSGGVLSPEFFEHNSSGYEIEATLFYAVSDSLRLTFSSGYSWWNETLGPGGATFRGVPLLFGLRFPFFTGRISPYLSGETGVHFIKRRYTLEVFDQGGIYGIYRLISSGPASESTTRLAFRLGAGVTIFVTDALDIDLSAKYGRINYDYVYQYPMGWYRSSVNLFAVTAGLRCGL